MDKSHDFIFSTFRHRGSENAIDDKVYVQISKFNSWYTVRAMCMTGDIYDVKYS